MKKIIDRIKGLFIRVSNKLGFSLRTKLIIMFLTVKIIPLIIVVAIAWQQIAFLGSVLSDIAVQDSTEALNDSAVENIERMTTDTAKEVANFLYARDDDLLYLAGLAPTAENYQKFSDSHLSKIITSGEWALSPDGQSWEPTTEKPQKENEGKSTNLENNDRDGFHYRPSEDFSYEMIPLYDEITYVDLEGNELVKYVAPDSTKKNHPLDAGLNNVADKAGTYVKAETYFEKLSALQPGEIYVSDVIGAYVGSNYIGMYTPEIVAAASADRGYDIPYEPESQAYAGQENPDGTRFEGIVRFATPVTGQSGAVTGYVTFALNHDHIMEFVDHITPMSERYTELPSAYEGNYAFIWDYQCRSICHPRHHSIVGYDPETGNPEVPWLESSIYDAWRDSGDADWFDYAAGLETFDNQSRTKTPTPSLTQAGLVGLDGRYLNNAPQCTGWMDLTVDGGSGSFYILWSGLYKLTTAGAIPYYTGQYAPSEDNGYSRRGFGIVTIGAGLEDFTAPASATAEKLQEAARDNLSSTSIQLLITTCAAILIMIIIAIWIASSLGANITRLIAGISRFRSGERQFRFDSPVNDEFGTLADSFDDMADSIVMSVKNALAITDLNQKVLYMNEKGLEMCGMTLDEICGTYYGASSVYPENSVYSPIKALEEGREAEIYYISETKTYIRGTANYFMGKDGEKLGYIIETADMTEMVSEQMKIEEQRALLGVIFSASPDLIWYQDTEGNFITVNPRFASISGERPEDVIGKNNVHMLPEENARLFAQYDQKALETRGPVYSEEKIHFADGHEEILDVVRTPIFDAAGEAPAGILGFGRNVTARHDIESELRVTQLELQAAVHDANEANRHKGDFLARMSHEIRTPMNAIIGLTNIVLNAIDKGGADLNAIKGNVQQIEASSQHLMGLINDILDISKIEAGKIELVYEPADMGQLAASVSNMIRPRCNEKNIRFIANIDDFSSYSYLTDSLRLRQVLINLLGNAVKFTPEDGEIQLSIVKLDSRGGQARLRFSVKDNGIGIAEEAQKHIFEAFEQAGSNITRQYGGTGLGLAISVRIVRMFGGELALQSTLGKGSTFSFDLWFDASENKDGGFDGILDYTGAFKGKRLLLVDDIEINRMIVKSMLEATGAEIQEGVDGSDACEQFAESPENTYDAILMDIQMPKMDGHEASRRIRSLPRQDAKTVPIIALTANAFKEDMDKAISSGMNAHLAKPIDPDTLLQLLYQYLMGGTEKGAE